MSTFRKIRLAILAVSVAIYAIYHFMEAQQPHLGPTSVSAPASATQ